MVETFQALLKHELKSLPEVVELSESDLPAGDVTVAVEYSALNYKDGLALTGRAPILRSFPMVPGIDFAGTVTASASSDVSVGQRVLLNGWGVGERQHGGFAQRARVNAKWLVPVPQGLSTKQAMQIGTAGYTAMLCVLALEQAGVAPDSGEVLVTGAAGGVGSVAVALLAGRGHRVVASTGRPKETEYLEKLGASQVVARELFSSPGKPLAKERWAGAVDVAGSHTLVNVLSQTKYGGTVTACGLAQGSELPLTVLPFILRQVKLVGIDSVKAPMALRRKAWQHLTSELDLEKLAAMSRTVGLEQLAEEAPKIVAGQVRGRLVVDLNSQGS